MGELGSFTIKETLAGFSLTGRDLRDWPGRRQRHSVTQSCFEIVHPLTAEPWGVRRFFVRALDGNVVNIANHKDEHGNSRRPRPQRSAPGGRPGSDSGAVRPPAGQSGGAARLGWRHWSARSFMARSAAATRRRRRQRPRSSAALWTSGRSRSASTHRRRLGACRGYRVARGPRPPRRARQQRADRAGRGAGRGHRR